jgi:hypothetical protein
MALRIKEVHPSVVGQSGNRNAFAIYDGSKLVYKTTRGGGQGSPMYGLSRTKADFLLAKEQAKRAGGGKASKATRASASTSRPSRQKLDRQELTVTGCTNFLRAEGYTVGKKKGSSRKKAKTLDEMLEDGDISFMEAVAMGYEANPRRRRRRKNPGHALPLGLEDKSTYGLSRGVSVSADYFVNPTTGDNFIEFNLISYPGDMKVLGEPFEANNEYTMFANYDQNRGVWIINSPHSTGTLAGTTLKEMANEVALDLAAFFSGVAPDGSLIERDNPRKRTRKKQRKAADTLFRGKKGASKFHLKRELAALKRAKESLRLEYNNDLISLDDYRTMDLDLESQMEMIERELGMYDNPRSDRRFEKLRARRGKDGRMRYYGYRNGKYGVISQAEYKKRIKERAPRDSQGRFKKRKNPRAMRRLR